MKSLLYVLLLLFSLSEAYKILGIFPYSGKSHFNIFEPLMKGLADKGHDVTVLSLFPQTKPYSNYKDLILKKSQHDSMSSLSMDEFPNNRLRHYGALYMLYLFGVDDCNAHLSSDVVKNLINNKEKYDVIIIESFNTDCFLTITHKLEAPFILISSSIMMPWNFEHMGNPDNPSYIPNHILDFSDKLTFLQRVENTIANVLCQMSYKWLYGRFANQISAKVFGETAPRPTDIAKNASLLFYNGHFSISRAKPHVPGIIEIGGIHIKKTKPLPQVSFV